MANVIYERYNPNVASTFGNVAAALDRTLARQHGYLDTIGTGIGNLLKTGASYIDERGRANELDGSNYLIEKLEKELAELRKEEAELMAELTALDAQNIAPKVEENDQQGVDQATDYLYLA